MQHIVQLDLLGQNDESHCSASLESRSAKSEVMSTTRGETPRRALLCRRRSVSSNDVNRALSTCVAASYEAKTMPSACNGATLHDGQTDEALRKCCCCCCCSRRLVCGCCTVAQPVVNGRGGSCSSGNAQSTPDGHGEDSRTSHNEAHINSSPDALLASKTLLPEQRELGALYAVACPPWIGLQESLHNTTTQPADATPFEQALRRALSMARERDVGVGRRVGSEAHSPAGDTGAIPGPTSPTPRSALQHGRTADATAAAQTTSRADGDDATTPQSMPLVEVHTSFMTDRLTTASSLGSTLSRTQPLWATVSSTTASPLQPASLPRMQQSVPCYRTTSARPVAPASHRVRSVGHSPASLGCTSRSLGGTARFAPPSVRDGALLPRALHTSLPSSPGGDVPRMLDDPSADGCLLETQLDASLHYFSLTDSLDSTRRTRASARECLEGDETSRWALLNVCGAAANTDNSSINNNNNNNNTTTSNTSGTTAAEWAHSHHEQATPLTRAMAATASDVAATPCMSDLLPLWTFSRPAALTRERGSLGRGRTGALGKLSRDQLSVQPLRALLGKQGAGNNVASCCSSSCNTGAAVASCASLTAMSSGIFSFSSRGAMMSRVELPLARSNTTASSSALGDRVVALAAVPTPPAFTAPPPSCYMACPTAAARDVLLLMRLETLARQELELTETWAWLWRRRWHGMRLAHSQTYDALTAYTQSAAQQQLSKRTPQALRFTWMQQQEEKLFLLRRHLHEEQRCYFDFFTIAYRHGVFDIYRAGQREVATEYMARMRCADVETATLPATQTQPVTCTAAHEMTSAARRSSDEQSRGSAMTLSHTCAADACQPAATTTPTTTTTATTTTTEGATDGEESGPLRTPRPHTAMHHSAPRLRVAVTSVPPSPDSRYTPLPMLDTTSTPASSSSASSSLTTALTPMREEGGNDGADARSSLRTVSESGHMRGAGSLTWTSLAHSTRSERAASTTHQQTGPSARMTSGVATLTNVPSTTTTLDGAVANASSCCAGVRASEGGLALSPSVEEMLAGPSSGSGAAITTTALTTLWRGMQRTQGEQQHFYRLYARYIPSSSSPVAFHDALALMHAVIADLCARGRRQRRRWQQQQLMKPSADGEAASFVEHAYTNGDVYLGQWAQGTRHGTGVYRFAAGRLLYVGEWRGGVPHGDGILLRVHVAGYAAGTPLVSSVVEKVTQGALDEAHCIVFGQWEMAAVTAIRAVFFDSAQ